MSIVIVDYGMGNSSSIKNMLKKVGANSIISNDIKEITSATKLVLPGVGSFDLAMKNIKESGLLPILEKKVLIDKTPILGICLGMQLMCSSSEEGIDKGLNWISADVKKFKFEDKSLRVPHMGWNIVRPKENKGLFENLFDDESRFYHVHSFFVKLVGDDVETASTEYGHDFTSAFQKNNIYGVQFHPEKSHKFGMQLFRNFIAV